MKYEYLTHYLNQVVEVRFDNRTIVGFLRQAEIDDGSHDVVEVEPNTEYSKVRYGNSLILVEAIRSIKIVKPYQDDDDDKCCDEAD